jgi:hypothetical protein
MKALRVRTACILFASVVCASGQQSSTKPPTTGRYQLVTAQIDVPQANSTASAPAGTTIPPFVPQGLTEAGFEAWRNTQTTFHEQLYEARAKAQALADARGIPLSQLTPAEWDQIYGLQQPTTTVRVVLMIDTETGAVWRYQPSGDVLIQVGQIDSPRPTPSTPQK